MVAARWWMPSRMASRPRSGFIKYLRPRREGEPMPDLSVNFCGVRSPNPFWLASGPPTNTAGQVMRAFEAGWGGAVWKTVGEPIVNTASRYGGVDLGSEKLMGFNNIELISDRPVLENLREVAEVKRRFPHHALVVSLMVES